MRRIALATVTIVTIAMSSVAATEPAGAVRAPAKATITVTPSTGLVGGQTVSVSGTGFTGGASLASAECKAGTVSTSDCDLSNTRFTTAASDGSYQLDFTVHAQLTTNNGPVDCTTSDGACVIGVADGLDITGSAVTAPISFVPLGPPTAGAIDVPDRPVATASDVFVTGTEFAAGAKIETDFCATGAAGPNDCDNFPFEVFADATGTFTRDYFPPATINTPGGDTIDCTALGACEFAAWDSRDFTASLTSHPLVFAPEVAGTIDVSPSTGLRDGDTVTVTGAGWPADLTLYLAECDSTDPTANCFDFAGVRADAHGNVSAPFSVDAGNDTPFVDCEAGPCFLVATWYADHSTPTATKKIVFDTAPDTETSNYSSGELAAITTAANTLGLTNEELQHLGSWALSWVLALTRTGTITPAPNTGAHSVTTTWPPAEHGDMRNFAAAHGTTLPEYQKTAALFVAYVLALQG